MLSFYTVAQQTITGSPINLSCEVKQNPQIIQNEFQLNMLGCNTSLPQYIFNSTLIGTSVKTGGMPIIGWHVGGQRQGNQIYIKLHVSISGYDDSKITEPVWFSIPKIKDTDKVSVDIEYVHLDICEDCEVLELPPNIGENTHVVIESERDYNILFEYRDDIPQIDFNKYILIGYTFRSAAPSGSSSKNKYQYYLEILPQAKYTNINIIMVGPSANAYVNHKWIVWFTIPKSLFNTNLNIYHNHIYQDENSQSYYTCVHHVLRYAKFFFCSTIQRRNTAHFQE